MEVSEFRKPIPGMTLKQNAQVLIPGVTIRQTSGLHGRVWRISDGNGKVVAQAKQIDQAWIKAIQRAHKPQTEVPAP